MGMPQVPAQKIVLFSCRFISGNGFLDQHQNTPNHHTYGITIMAQTSTIRILYPHRSQVPLRDGWQS